jgi:four helix bundle protein
MSVLFKRFEDIKAWQIANQLTLDIYKILNKNKDFDYNRQIQRASVSIMNNIAEGFECVSKQAFYNHLRIAKGSCGEVRSMLILGNQLHYFSQSESESLIEKSLETSKLLFGLMKSLKEHI